MKRTSFANIPNHPFTFIEGHRGVNRLQPENTLNSFKESISYKIDAIELDVWLTKDKIPVVIHGGDNGDISKTTNGKGGVNSLTLKELDNFKTLEGNLKIPTLEEVLQLCQNKIFINIELKDSQVKETFTEVMKLVEKYDMLNQIALSSFDHKYYEEVKAYPRKIEFGFLYDQKKKRKNDINYDNISNCSINISVKDINEEIIKKAHEKGIAVMCWCNFKFKKEGEELYQKVFKLGVDVLCCNEPEKAILSRNKFFGLC